MSEWSTCAVTDSFVKTKISRKHQIPAKDIIGAGNFPVIDQGQDFIAGYCDDREKVIDFDLPLVIFGDHTRCFKYVDFPFVLGADGTKVLSPNKDFYEPKFYYFALLALDLPSRGYNRHFKMLKERNLPLPPLSEQQKISHILSTVQWAIEAQERLIQTTTELKKALMHKLFTEGLRNEPQKQTEIGPIPESWDVQKLGKIAKTISKGSSPKWQGFNYTDSGILFIRSQNIGNGKMLLEEKAYLPAEFNEKEKRSILQSGDILINLVGASIGRVALGTDEINGGNCNQAVAFVRLDRTLCLKQFIVYFLLSPWGQEQMRRQKKDIARANLSLLDVSGFKIPLPQTEEEIEEVAGSLVSLEQKISTHKRKRDSLQDLFRTLLHKLMTAKIRV